MSTVNCYPLNLELYSLFWLDNQTSLNEEVQNAQAEVRLSVNNLRVFEEVEECLRSIRQLPEKQIIVVLNAQVSQTILDDVHSLTQVIAIYIYFEYERSDLKNYPKVKGWNTSVKDLVWTIQKDQLIRKRKQSTLMINAVELSSKDISGDFLNSELLIEAFLVSDSYIDERVKLIQFCRDRYRENEVQLKYIEEFEKDYSSDKALFWYTRDTFLYRMLNETLRQANIDLLVLFQFLIKDIYLQLKQLQSISSSPLSKVYRGQLMSLEEIAILMSCEGQLVSMNSFLSTSKDEQYALAIVESGSSNSGDVRSVLFIIEIDINLSDLKPYADISDQSRMEHEDEVLIMAGSIFRIKKVFSKDNGLTWIMELSLTNVDQYEVKDLFNHMRPRAYPDSQCHALEYILCCLGYYNTAERFCLRKLRGQLSLSGETNISQVLGSIYEQRGEYNYALQFLCKFLQKLGQTNASSDESIAIISGSISNVYFKKGDMKEALSYRLKTTNMFKVIYGTEHEYVGVSYHNMGNIFLQQKKFSLALFCFREAIKINEIALPKNHPVIAASYSSMGIAYDGLKQFDLVFQYFQRSLDMKLMSLPSDHIDLGHGYRNMSISYRREVNIPESLILSKKALNILEKKLPPSHPYIIEIKENIDLGEKLLPLALQFNNEQLRLIAKIAPFAHIYTDVGSVHIDGL